MKVLFFGAGKMGDLVANVLEGIEGLTVLHASLHAGEPIEDEFDLVFSASWPHRISQEMCQKGRLGAVNLHTSLLPEGRGWHPLNWALIWGKDKTGITIHKIVDSFDAGDICVQHEIPIFITDNIRILRERVDTLVPQVINAFFEDPQKYLREAKQQNQAQASYAQKRIPEDSQLNLNAEPVEIWNLYRSCDPDEYPAFVKDETGTVNVKECLLKGNGKFDIVL